jgi:hypothetical protein
MEGGLFMARRIWEVLRKGVREKPVCSIIFRRIIKEQSQILLISADKYCRKISNLSYSSRDFGFWMMRSFINYLVR